MGVAIVLIVVGIVVGLVLGNLAPSWTELTRAAKPDTGTQRDVAALEKDLAALYQQYMRALDHIGTLQRELAEIKEPVSILRYAEKPEQLFAPANLTVWALPREGFMPLNTIPQGCVFPVLEAAQPYGPDTSPLWFYVEIPWVGDSPVNTRGWVSAGDTAPFNADVQDEVRCPVTIEPTVLIYEVEEFTDISSSTAREAGRTLKGIVRETRADYSLVTIGAHLTVWVNTEDLQFPSPR